MSEYDLREFGYARVSKRGPYSLAVIIPARARDFGGLEADTEYRVSAAPKRKRLTFLRDGDPEDMGELDAGDATVRSSQTGVYVTLSPKLLDVLDVGHGDKVSVEVAEDGTFAFEPW